MPTKPGPEVTVPADHFERVMAAMMEQAETRHESLRTELRQAVSEGVRSGVMELVKDDEFVVRFWRRGYDEVTKHGRDDVSRSIGRRVLTWVSGILLSIGVYLAVKAGVIK